MSTTSLDKHSPTSSEAPSLGTSPSSYIPSTVSSAMSGLFRRFTSDPYPHDSVKLSSERSPTFPQSRNNSTASGTDGVYTPPHRTASPFQPPPLYPISLRGFSENTAPSAQLLNRTLAEEIRLLVPPRLQLCEEWNLVYSLEQDGVSLGTLYKKCDELRGLRNGFVLVVKDGEGGVCFDLPIIPEVTNCASYSSSALISQRHLTYRHITTAQANVFSGELLSFLLPRC
jgi:hypothetical protein